MSRKNLVLTFWHLNLSIMATLIPDGKRALDNFIRETTESGEVPAIVLGIANVEGEIYFQGGGLRVVGDMLSEEVNPDSVFWMCSQTKLITALAVLKLIENRALSLNTPIGDHLPEFRNLVIVEKTSTFNTKFRPCTTVLTVKHLLTFTSGLFYPVVKEDISSLPEAYTSKDMHATIDPLQSFYRIVMGPLPGVPLKFEPGTDFAYGFNSDALGFLVEKVSGQTLGQFCKEHIFGPLDADSCSFLLTPELKRRFVSLSYRNKDGSLSPCTGEVKIIEQDPDKVRLHLGGAGLYSSMRDYLKILIHTTDKCGEDHTECSFQSRNRSSTVRAISDGKGGKISFGINHHGAWHTVGCRPCNSDAELP